MTRVSLALPTALFLVFALNTAALGQIEGGDELSSCVAGCTGTCGGEFACDCLHQCAFSAVLSGESELDDTCEAVCLLEELSSADCPGSCVDTCNDLDEGEVQLEMCLEDCQMACGDEAADPRSCRQACWLTCAAGNATCWERCGSAGRASPLDPTVNGSCIGKCERAWHERVTGETGCAQVCCAQCSADMSCVGRCTRDCDAGWGDTSVWSGDLWVICPRECGEAFEELRAAKECAASCEDAWSGAE